MDSLADVICCGLSCMDVELQSCAVPKSRESIVEFRGTRSVAGGCAPQTSRALAALGVRVALVAAIGDDSRGKELCELSGLNGRVQVLTSVSPSSQTSVAFLPIFKDGTRACFVDLGVNLIADADFLMPKERLSTLSQLRVFHFGYPHIMPQLQGAGLKLLFEKVRHAAPQALITMDVNGAKASDVEEPVLEAALTAVAMVHANLDEACIITGLFRADKSGTLSADEIKPLVQWFTDRGAGSTFITCGRNGVFAGTGVENASDVLLSAEIEKGAFIYRPAYAVTVGNVVNASGAGDAFSAGVIAELEKSRGSSGLKQIADAGLASALYRIDPTLSPLCPTELERIMHLASLRPRLRPWGTLRVEQYEDKSLSYAT